MLLPYPITEAVFEQVLAGTHPSIKIDEPEAFWAFYLSCFDLSRPDGARYSDAVQSRLRKLIASQLIFGDSGEIIGAQPSLFLQFSGNSFCFVALSDDPSERREELVLLQQCGAIMPSHPEDGDYPFWISPNDKLVQTKANNVFVLMLKRGINEGNIDNGICLAGGFAAYLDPDLLDAASKREGAHTLPSKYDNVTYNSVFDQAFILDPSSDPTEVDAIKRSAASRQMTTKGLAIAKANRQGPELEEMKKLLHSATPSSGIRSFKASAFTTAIPDPSRLRDVCPSQDTLDKLKHYLDPRVSQHWRKTLESKPLIVNDLLPSSEDINPNTDPNRLKYPVSATFVGHMSVKQAVQLAALSKAGVVGRDNYSFSLISLLEVARPAKLTYPHEFYLSLMATAAPRFNASADFLDFMRRAASRIIDAITLGRFDAILTGANFTKIFQQKETTEEEILVKLKKLAYFNLRGFCDEYIYKPETLAAAYKLKPKGPKVAVAEYELLNEQFEALWTSSLPAIQGAIKRKFSEIQRLQPPVVTGGVKLANRT